jgi:hypothetical protein
MCLLRSLGSVSWATNDNGVIANAHCVKAEPLVVRGTVGGKVGIFHV